MTPELLIGDCLLYLPTDLIGRLICLKTWSRFCHVEIYIGGGMSVASRNGIGVNIYKLRENDLGAVLRPTVAVDKEAAMKWFYAHAAGQKYGWLDLLAFFLIVKRGNKHQMICSQFAARWYHAAKVPAFNARYDAGKVAPADFPMSAVLEWIWMAGGV